MGLGRLVQSRAISSLPWVQAFDTAADVFGQGVRSSSGQAVDECSAMQLLAVFGAVNFIVSHGETFPRDTYRQIGSKPTENVANPAWLDAFPLGSLIYSYLLDGNAFGVPVRDAAGAMVGLIPLDPCDVDMRMVGGKVAVWIEGKPYSGEFWHVPHLVPPGCIRGINPIEAARQSIGMGLAAAEFGGRFFGQGTVMSGVLQFPGPRPANEDLKSIRENWTRVHGGSSSAHLPGVLFGGAEWKPISIPPEQAQFLETRRYTAAEIVGQLFLLPPQALGIAVEAGNTVNYQNVQTEWANILRRLQPMLVKFERAISMLMPQRYWMKFNLSAYLRADAKTRYETHKVGIDGKFLTPNEARAFENLPPLPGGDQFPPASPPPAPPAP